MQKGLAALALVVFASLIAASVMAWSPVPLDDGWPVYDRLMEYLQGTVDLRTYLLMPHGAHPHSIVYALYLLDLPLGARQILPHLVSVACIAATAIMMAVLVRHAILQRSKPYLGYIGAAAALVIVPTLSAEVMAPFQVVLTASRLVYCVSIAAFVVVLRRRLDLFDYAMIAVSCVFVTFHGSGLLFGVIVLIQHLMLGRSWTQRIAGAAPLLISVLYTRTWLPPGDLEMAGLAEWLSVFDPRAVLDLLVATFAYYGVPLVPVWMDPAYSDGLIVAGALVAVVVSFWSIIVLVHFPRHNSAAISLALISLFVALSAASAGLVWESRSIAGLSGESAINVLEARRYSAIALLAYATLAVPLLTLSEWFSKIGLAILALVAGTLLVASYNSVQERAVLTDTLNEAATAIYAGVDVTDPLVALLWPSLIRDWYWPSELPVLVDFMNERHIGYAYGLPSIGTSAASWWQTSIQNAVVGPTQTVGICSISGMIPTIDQDILSQPNLLAVTNSEGTVIGAVALPRHLESSSVSGHVQCPDGPAAVTATRVVAPRASVN